VDCVQGGHILASVAGSLQGDCATRTDRFRHRIRPIAESARGRPAQALDANAGPHRPCARRRAWGRDKKTWELFGLAFFVVIERNAWCLAFDRRCGQASSLSGDEHSQGPSAPIQQSTSASNTLDECRALPQLNRSRNQWRDEEQTRWKWERILWGTVEAAAARCPRRGLESCAPAPRVFRSRARRLNARKRSRSGGHRRFARPSRLS